MKENKVNTVKRERDIISQLDHPYVIQLYCTFQTETHLFFALTLASNGCLLDLLLKWVLSSTLNILCIELKLEFMPVRYIILLFKKTIYFNN